MVGMYGPAKEEWEEQGYCSDEAWLKAGELGLFALCVPEEYGGAGLVFSYSALIMEEVAKYQIASPEMSMHSDIVAPYIVKHGSEYLKQRYLPKMVTGEIIGSLAMTEPSTGSDVQAIKTRAIKDGNSYKLSGQKTFITNGQHANLIIVAAKTNPTEGSKGTSLVVVETDGADGFARGRNLDKIGAHAADTSELFFDNVEIPPENILGGIENQGFYQMMQQLPQERLLQCVRASSALEAALEWTVTHVTERKAFGKELVEFQAVQMKLAEKQDAADKAMVEIEKALASASRWRSP